MKSIRVPLSSPDITESDRKKVLEVLQTPNLSSGPKLKEFETKFAKYIGSTYAVAVNSGTSGLHLCIKALRIKEGEYVLTTPFSFIASANCILFEKAKPVFTDIDEKTLNMDVNRLKEILKKLKSKNKMPKAILPVHIFGRPCEMVKILELAEEYELRIIEDACEAVGAEISEGNEKQNPKWQKVGTIGDCGVFGFYPNKQMTTGEGGMIVTSDANIYEQCRSMRNQGRSADESWLQHEQLGYNYRISDINCALGISQLEKIDETLAKRERVVKLYNERLEGVKEVITPIFEKSKKISWFVYVVRLNDRYSREKRESILNKLKEKGIGCSNYFPPIHLQPFYRKMFGFKEGDFPVTEKVSARTIALPFYNDLREEQIDYVCENLKEIIQSL